MKSCEIENVRKEKKLKIKRNVLEGLAPRYPNSNLPNFYSVFRGF